MSLSRMDSGDEEDKISNLPEAILVMIISCLPFKDCVRTSGVSRLWRHLYRQTRNVSFRQSDFVSPALYDQPELYGTAMVAFVECMYRWITTNNHHPIDSFELCINDTEGYFEVTSIKNMIEFGIRKGVKKLVLDFSNPDWEYYDDVVPFELFFEVPESVYNLTTLESLRVFACKNFDPSRFSNPGNFKSLSFGWMSMEDLQPLLSKSSKLDSLTIKGCWDLYFEKLEGNMREFVVQCSALSCSLNLPQLEIFRYSGDILRLEFERMNRVIKEVYLDFCGLIVDDGEMMDPTYLQVNALPDSLNHFPSSTTLTLSPYVLQVIQKSEHPHLLHQVKTQHLVLKTELHPKDFTGIWLILKSCQELETLTFDLLPPSSVVTLSSYAGIDPPTSWMKNIAIPYLRKTIKVVVVRNFVGGPREFNLVKDLIKSGREREALLKKLQLCVADGLDNSQKEFAYARAEMLQQSSNCVQVLVD